MNTLNLPDLLTIRQASHMLNVHPNTLRNWERSGLIDAVRIGRRKDRRFSKSSLFSLLGKKEPSI